MCGCMDWRSLREIVLLKVTVNLSRKLVTWRNQQWKESNPIRRVSGQGGVCSMWMYVGFDCEALFDYTGMTGFRGSIPELLRGLPSPSLKIWFPLLLKSFWIFNTFTLTALILHVASGCFCCFLTPTFWILPFCIPLNTFVLLPLFYFLMCFSKVYCVFWSIISPLL